MGIEKYLTATEGMLGIIQATLPEERREKSAQASMEMWKAIREVTEKYELDVAEMFNATLSCHKEILEVVNEQVQETKEELAKNE